MLPSTPDPDRYSITSERAGATSGDFVPSPEGDCDGADQNRVEEGEGEGEGAV